MEASTFKRKAKVAGEQDIEDGLIENESDENLFKKIEERAKESTPMGFKDLQNEHPPQISTRRNNIRDTKHKKEG